MIGCIAFSSTLCWAEIRVVDDIGREVVLDKPASSIISLSPHTTENLFTAGAGHKIVGVVDYSDYPPQAKQIQLVGTHVQFNIESIVSLSPDLIVAWQSGNPKEAIQQLEELGFTTYVSQPYSVEDIVNNIKKLAVLAGTEEKLGPDLETSLQKVQELQADHQPKSRLSMFYQISTEPLITLSGKHIVSQSLEKCGAVNVFSEMPILAPHISIESIVDINPQVILAGLVDGRIPDMSFWEGWDSIQAVKQRNYVFVDPDVMFRPTLRMLKGILKFCEDLDQIRKTSRLPMK